MPGNGSTRPSAADNQPPSIASATAQPSTLGPGQSEIRLSATASDNIGVKDVSVYAAMSGTNQQIIVAISPDTDGVIYLSHIDGTAQNGRWAGTITFPSNIPDGRYTITFKANDNGLPFSNVSSISIPVTLQRTAAAGSMPSSIPATISNAPTPTPPTTPSITPSTSPSTP